MGSVPGSGDPGWTDRLPGPDDPVAAHRTTRIAELLAVDPLGLGGAVVGGGGPEREAWLGLLDTLDPAGRPTRRLPAGSGPEALLGGLDLEATLTAGRPVHRPGLLGAADRARLVIPGAERLPHRNLGPLLEALDRRAVSVERDGISLTRPARVCLLLLDEGTADDPGVPASLLDRLAFRVCPPPRWRTAGSYAALRERVAAARGTHARIEVPKEPLEVLVEAARRLGVGSLRVPLLALRAARASAALDGSGRIGEEHVLEAAELVLGPRSGRSGGGEPEPEEARPGDAREGNTEETPPEGSGRDRDPRGDREQAGRSPDAGKSGGRRAGGRREGAGARPDGEHDIEEEGSAAGAADRVVAAVRTAVPAGLLEDAAGRGVRSGPSGSRGRGGGRAASGARRGRPAGVRRGTPGRDGPLDLLATLRAAAPRQRLRSPADEDGTSGDRLRIRPEDFRVRRLESRPGRTSIFVVDASGSQALNRMAETKGAVQHVLAESYARRDRVAVVTFRDRDARLLLPPTRALARARRELAGLPGGGGTPLGAGLAAGLEVAERERRDGREPRLLLLTDGRANVARDGGRGRRAGEIDALRAADGVAASRVPLLVIDTSRRGEALARRLAARATGRYLRLPRPSSAALGALARAPGPAAPVEAARAGGTGGGPGPRPG